MAIVVVLVIFCAQIQQQVQATSIIGRVGDGYKAGWCSSGVEEAAEDDDDNN